MSREIDIARLMRMRDRVLLASALGFLLWQGGWLATDLLPAGGMRSAAIGATMAGALAWGIATVALVRYFGRVRKARAEAELNDELARYRQDRAFVIAYWVVAGTISLMLGLEGFFDIDPAVLLRSLIILAVVTPLTAFLWLDRDSGESA